MQSAVELKIVWFSLSIQQHTNYTLFVFHAFTCYYQVFISMLYCERLNGALFV